MIDLIFMMTIYFVAYTYYKINYDINNIVKSKISLLFEIIALKNALFLL
jgi:hypothetical protein